METNFASELALSILVFAPGVVLLGFAFFMGIMVAVERSGLFGTRGAKQAAELEAARQER